MQKNSWPQLQLCEIKFSTNLHSVVYALKVMINVYKWYQGQVRALSTNRRKTIERIDGTRHIQHVQIFGSSELGQDRRASRFAIFSALRVSPQSPSPAAPHVHDKETKDPLQTHRGRVNHTQSNHCETCPHES